MPESSGSGIAFFVILFPWACVKVTIGSKIDMDMLWKIHGKVWFMASIKHADYIDRHFPLSSHPDTDFSLLEDKSLFIEWLKFNTWVFLSVLENLYDVYIHV